MTDSQHCTTLTAILQALSDFQAGGTDLSPVARRYPASALLSPASIFSAASSCIPGITRLVRRLQPFCNPTARSSLVLAGIAWDGTLTIPLEISYFLVLPVPILD